MVMIDEIVVVVSSDGIYRVMLPCFSDSNENDGDSDSSRDDEIV